ncbi:hypothetical protein CDEST_12364 [Colletotrichum destructivum]|uniref:Uncharacterized protein n=1 Tax=Colletotrichum destructivum TaxID=34406 RepID=A0AAX4IVU5_9PEZI|nr:hypothetical protein CDEST_12364 [Colletotrichum destructivum]
MDLCETGEAKERRIIALDAQLCKSRENSLGKQERVELSEKIQERYGAGHNLYTKEQLTSLMKQIANKTTPCRIIIMNGKMTEDYDDPERCFREQLEHLSETFLLCRLGARSTALSTDLSPRRRGRCEDTCGFRGARDGFGGKSAIWDTQKYSVLAPTASEMNKIVSFGLGDLPDDEHAKSEQCQDDRRNRNQHEAVLTMARVLKERLGFFDANDLTLVFSVFEGIPVKQIIADLARAAIVIWVIIMLPGDGGRGWVLMKHGDNET